MQIMKPPQYQLKKLEGMNRLIRQNEQILCELRAINENLETFNLVFSTCSGRRKNH
jgi:glycyl-tRNA synthetase (class II)